MPNPHVNLVNPAEMSEEIRTVYDESLKRTGEADVIQVFANHPELTLWYFNGFYKDMFYNNQPGMELDVRTKEILRMKLSKQHGCYFCNLSNSVDALSVGITQEQIDNILTPTEEYFDEKDLAVIELASQLMLQNNHGEMTKELYDRLKKYYSDKAIVEMGFIGAVLTGMAKFLFTYDLVTREEICPVVPKSTA